MDYYCNTQKVMKFLKEKRVCLSSRASHEECYLVFAEYLNTNGLVYSTNTVKQWLTSIKGIYSWQKCYFWNQYMTQLTEMISSGTISDRHLYLIKSSYKKVPDSLRSELDKYLDSCRDKYSNRSWELARIHCSEVMLFFSDRGLKKIKEITYQDIISLYNVDLFCTDDTKSVILGHAARMMSFFAGNGLCSRGYSMLLGSKTYPYVGVLAEFSQDHLIAIDQLRKQSLDFPADGFYDSINHLTVMDSLGHQDNTSVMKYLSLDEERMQSCALSLSDTGLLLKKGGLL